MPSMTENDAEDINDFLKRIQELGSKRDQEDEERNRKLEEEILQGRKERQARRAERARSISSPKDLNSPAYIHIAEGDIRSSRATLSPAPDLHLPNESFTSDSISGDSMERLTDGPPPTENSTPVTNFIRDSLEAMEGSSPTKASPSRAIPSSRNPPLYWQQRSNSQVSGQSRSRPLSMVAAENATHSSTVTLDSSSSGDERLPTSRHQISQSLCLKDAAGFHQPVERGEGLPAGRKRQIGDNRAINMINTSRMQPGMTSEQPEKINSASSDEASTALQTDASSANANTGKTAYGKTLISRGLGSPLPLMSDRRSDLTKSDTASYKSDETSDVVRGLAMSPSQGRISPERLDRSISPTKGIGGFVQSAMMKRSDSVSKRWSVQSPQGLNRGNSVSSNRGNRDSVHNIGLGGITTAQARESCRTTLSQDNSPLSLSRPTSGHSNATNIKDDGSDLSKITSPNAEAMVHSPTKVTDNRRWSPTKSSWLESALSKPDSPKPKMALPPPPPSWMLEINKVKQQKAAAESARGTPVYKHEVNIGGLLRSSQPSGLASSLVTSGLPSGRISGNTMATGTEVEKKMSSVSSPTSPGNLQGLSASTSDSPKTKIPATTPLASNSPTVSEKYKSEAFSRADFRSNLRPKQVPSEGENKQEPEFKNVFSQLRRTKTQNYVAPDELKDNILRGKAALNVTGGPKKTEHKDEFKEAILKKKEDFKKAQLEGTGVIRNTSGVHNSSPVPEALAKKASLGKTPASPDFESTKSKDVVSGVAGHTLGHQVAGSSKLSSVDDRVAASRLFNKESGSKLAERFNPALASLIAKGPPSITSDAARVPSSTFPQSKTITSEADMQVSGPELTHLTKDRVRGPRKKIPTVMAHSQGLDVTDVKVQNVKSAIYTLPTRQPDLSSLGIVQDAENIVPKLQSDAENETVRTSIDKSNFGRQSGNVLNKNEEMPRPLKSHMQSSPIKETRENELFMAKSKAETVLNAHPLIKPRSSLTSSSEPDNRINAIGSNAGDASYGKPTSKNYLELTENTTTEKADKKSLALRFESDILMTDQNFSALLNRKPTLAFPEKPTPAEEPIKSRTPNDTEVIRANTGSLSSRISIGNGSASAIGQNSVPQPKTGSAAAASPASIRPRPVPGPLSGASLQTSSIPSFTARSVALPSVPHSSEALQLVTEFFGKKEFVQDLNFDTSSILLAKTEQFPTIKTLRSQLFQITGDGKKQQVPSHQERILFQSDMYICPHTFGTLGGTKVIEVYFWAGDDVPESSIDDAELFAQREARNAGGKLVKMRQGKECAQFIEALGGIMITRRGSSNKYDSLAPHILCGRRYAGQIVFDEVDFSPKSLCSGFPYLISTQSGKCYLWKGRGSSIDEISCARLIGMDFGATGEVEEIEDGHEPDSFVKIFIDDTEFLKSADHWRLKPNYEKYSSRLFRVESSTKSKILEISPFTQTDLSSSNIYVLDAFFEIYIVVGAHSQTQYPAFCTALLFAQDYGILAAGMEDRPFVPVSTVVLGGVPRDLKFVFRKWRDDLAPTVVHFPSMTLARGRSLRVVPLSAALDAARFQKPSLC